MTIGTLFTLFVTPAVYTYLARDHQKARRALEAEEAGGQGSVDGRGGREAGILFPAEAGSPPRLRPTPRPARGRGRLPTAAE